MPNDRRVPVQFLQTAFDAGDWIGVLLKTYRTGRVVQRIVSRDTATSDRFQGWLRHMNAHGWNVYVSVNAYRPGRSRARDAVASVRHLFLEEDHDGPGLLAELSTRPDLPPPSYVVHSSPGRLHVLWRVRDIPPARIEQLQKRLARELGTDRAATSSAQTTRLPGFFNHKRRPPVRVGIEFLPGDEVFAPDDLPDTGSASRPATAPRASQAASAAGSRGPCASVPSTCRSGCRRAARRSAHLSCVLSRRARVRSRRRGRDAGAVRVERPLRAALDGARLAAEGHECPTVRQGTPRRSSVRARHANACKCR